MSESWTDTRWKDRGRTVEGPQKDLGRALEGPRKDLGRTLEGPWKDLGRTLEGPWKDLGRTLEGPCKDLGRTLGGPWKDLGRTLDGPQTDLGRTLDRPWKPTGTWKHLIRMFTLWKQSEKHKSNGHVFEVCVCNVFRIQVLKFAQRCSPNKRKPKYNYIGHEISQC
jgi:hypothetical protein